MRFVVFFWASLQREGGRVECIGCCLMRGWHDGSEIFTTTYKNNGVIMTQLIASRQVSKPATKASKLASNPASKHASEQVSLRGIATKRASKYARQLAI